MLYVVPTPLGNLKDITERAKEQLATCDFIIAENPSTTRKLLQLLKLPPKSPKLEIVQFADHNEQKVLHTYLDRLEKQDACLVSDAGTPGVSDPGFRLVRSARERGIQVSALPGANAVTTALSASGLPTDRFLFVGFFPKTEFKVIEYINLAKITTATLIAYESPQRIIKTMGYIANNFPEANVVIARELTKIHEEYISGIPSEIVNILRTKKSIKGEITLLLSFK